MSTTRPLHPLEKRMFACIKKHANLAELKTVVAEIIAENKKSAEEKMPRPNINVRRPVNLMFKLLHGAGDHSALELAIIRGLPQVAQVLIEAKADINRILAPRYQQQFGTLAILSIAKDLPETFEQLIVAGADLTLTDGNGRNAFVYAAAAKSSQFVQILVKHGTPVDHPLPNNETLLSYAAKCDRIAIVEFLVTIKPVADFCIFYFSLVEKIWAHTEDAFDTLLFLSQLLLTEPYMVDSVFKFSLNCTVQYQQKNLRFKKFMLAKQNLSVVNFYFAQVACKNFQWGLAADYFQKAIHSSAAIYPSLIQSLLAGHRQEALRCFTQAIECYMNTYSNLEKRWKDHCFQKLIGLLRDFEFTNTVDERTEVFDGSFRSTQNGHFGGTPQEVLVIFDAFARGFNRCQELKILKLDLSGCTNKSIPLLAHALKDNVVLEELHLEPMHFYGYDTTILTNLAAALKTNKHLKKLVLVDYDLILKYFPPVVKAFDQALVENFSLQYLQLGSNSRLADTPSIEMKLERNRNLKHLSWMKVAVAVGCARTESEVKRSAIPLADEVAEFIVGEPLAKTCTFNLSNFWGSQFFPKLLELPPVSTEEKTETKETDKQLGALRSNSLR